MKRQPNSHPYVGKGGLKLEFALDAFGVEPTHWTAADLGSHVGGFVDCLLQRGAAKVYSVDTSYGTLAWKLRTDPRVVVMERTNAMHVRLPEPVDLVSIDAGGRGRRPSCLAPWTWSGPAASSSPSSSRSMKPTQRL